MVVQGIAVPKAPGSARDQEFANVPAASAAAPAEPARGFSFAPIVVPVLVVTQVGWLALLGYVLFRFL